MTLQWIGAILIIAGCGGVGFGMALNYRREENALRQLLQVLEMFCCELDYRMTPLPELFRKAIQATSGHLSKFFEALTRELEKQSDPDASRCVGAVLRNSRDLPASVFFALADLGRNLGEYDLQGQLVGIRAVARACQRQLEVLESNRPQRIRSFQTLGLCAGAALAILLL